GYRYAAADRGLSRRIHPVAGLDDIAQDDAADRCGVEARTLERLAHRRRTEIDRRGRLERAVEGADGGTHRMAEDDVARAHGISFPRVRAGGPGGGNQTPRATAVAMIRPKTTSAALCARNRCERSPSHCSASHPPPAAIVRRVRFASRGQS